MKTTKLTIVFMLLCMLVGCGNRNNPENLPTPEEMKPRALELAAYLTDNYQVGDSVFFRMTNGETEGFEVKTNKFAELWEQSEPEEGQEPITTFEGYSLGTLFFSSNNRLYVSIDHLCKWKTYSPYTEGSIMISGQADLSPFTLTERNDTLIIESQIYKCRLKKHKGIVYFSNAENTWTLVEKD